MSNLEILRRYMAAHNVPDTVFSITYKTSVETVTEENALAWKRKIERLLGPFDEFLFAEIARLHGMSEDDIRIARSCRGA